MPHKSFTHGGARNKEKSQREDSATENRQKKKSICSIDILRECVDHIWEQQERGQIVYDPPSIQPLSHVFLLFTIGDDELRCIILVRGTMVLKTVNSAPCGQTLRQFSFQIYGDLECRKKKKRNFFFSLGIRTIYIHSNWRDIWKRVGMERERERTSS